MKLPDYLQAGDTVAIVATARAISKTEVNSAVKILKSWGLTVKLGEHLLATQHQFAGTDEQRSADFQAALDDPSIKAIICARGGYGTVRIIDRLRFTKFAKHPKWIVGYSDISVLHAHLIQNLGTGSIHATMPINFLKHEGATLSLKKVLFGQQAHYSWKTDKLSREGKCKGILVGGNLSILYSLLGSTSDMDTKGKILFLEDVDEYLYHIDRMMMALKRAGKLKHLKGLIIGGMTDMKDNKIPFGKTAEAIVAEAVKEYQYPLCFHFTAGHIAENMAITFGRTVELTVKSGFSTLNFL